MKSLRDPQLERWIDQKTNGRIHRLGVECAGDRVIIHGCTSTHHAKQLALAAALDVVRSRQVELDICVGM